MILAAALGVELQRDPLGFAGHNEPVKFRNRAGEARNCNLN